MHNISIIILFVFIIIYILNLLYYFVSLKEKDIFILKKIKINKNNYNIFYVFDKDNVKYLIEPNFLNIICDNREILWNRIDEGKTFKIKYYGYDVGFMDMGYRITSIL